MVGDIATRNAALVRIQGYLLGDTRKRFLTAVRGWALSSSIHGNAGLCLCSSVITARINQPLFDQTSQAVESIFDIDIGLCRDLHEGDIELVG